MGTKNKQVELNDERRALVDRMYRKNRRLFKFLASKYAHNNEDSEDIEMYALQILMVWIAGTEKSDDEIMKYAGYYINRAYASAYKDINVNDKELKNNWNDIKIEYSVNSFWYKRDKDEGNIAYMNGLKGRKYATVESTAKSFIDANGLGGLGYGKIAELLNAYSIASKTKKGWSEFSVGNIFRKDSSQPELAYGNRIEELLGEGLMYKEIAETLNKENYTTKQGKAFNAKSIENYVKRKLK